MVVLVEFPYGVDNRRLNGPAEKVKPFARAVRLFGVVVRFTLDAEFLR